MILWIRQSGEIYAYSRKKTKADADGRNAVWYDGEFSETMGENIAGKKKKFFYENGKIRLEYEAQPEEPSAPTQLDSIEETQLTMMEAMADQYEESQAQQLTNMEVLATVYEELIALKGEGQ